MRIATWNINGVNGRLDLLLGWLREAEPDVVCLQELKAPHSAFPARAIAEAGYGAVWRGESRWNGVAILARNTRPVETRNSLPGDPDDGQSRYIEAAVNGVLIGCLYLPNGNPMPGPKFAYKLAWTDRLLGHAAELVRLEAPVVLAGDFNIIPTAADVANPRSWARDALFAPAPRRQFEALAGQGWTDALRTLHPQRPLYTFWHYYRDAFARDSGIRIDHLLLNPVAAPSLAAAGVDRHVRGWDHPSDHAPASIDLNLG